ncbi:MAG: hypothetical protein ACOVOO_03910 [Flavobacteriales bacterium]|jgi:hypothetical protein
MSTSKIFAYILSAIVLGVTLLALLGIWDVIDWSYVQRYFWKGVQSLIILSISGVIIYLIKIIFVREETSK